MAEKAVVTGAAGFIGSHVCDALLARGLRVTGIDSFNTNYDPRIKRANIAQALASDAFDLVEGSLNDVDLEAILKGASYVFHEAAQAGVRQSWQERFDEYVDANIRATQRLCEAARTSTIKRFVYASSSSVYGETTELPMSESHPTKPLSPYGVTKLSAEGLCLLYRANFGLPVVALRYFTVYGPRQRPDMAFHIFIRNALAGKPIEVFGNGTQTRDFTYIDDIVAANLAAMEYGGEEAVFNTGGGSRITLNRALDVLTSVLPSSAEVVFSDRVKGDVTHTYADISLASRELGYAPTTDIADGLAREVQWVKATYDEIEAKP